MKIFTKIEQWNRKIQGKHLNLAIWGSFLLVFILGSLYALDLVIISYPLLILAGLILAQYQYKNCKHWSLKNKVPYHTHWLGYTGILFLVFLLGIQSSYIPFKSVFLILSILLILPAIYDLVKKK